MNERVTRALSFEKKKKKSLNKQQPVLGVTRVLASKRTKMYPAENEWPSFKLLTSKNERRNKKEIKEKRAARVSP